MGEKCSISVMGRALNEQAHVVVGAYFDDVQARRYNEAYEAQCQDAKEQESQAEFASRVAADEPIASYRVGDIDLTAVDLAVPVDVTYENGDTGQVQVYLGQNSETGEFEVCGVEE